ncbi:hypothetical protein MPTK1_5g07500 [Marchantia polymorpha subsp. ruderalis]|uniref:Uncharacterized protein n=1 Tax=Marchantia polymorpha subsp. ruderalis TaxID=1480154 RepID=A0AAF6BFX9_MARPO|nr:hypothetical protein Mp_5g07500 [Marchantia polymorpha subsp. ruderalis]
MCTWCPGLYRQSNFCGLTFSNFGCTHPKFEMRTSEWKSLGTVMCLTSQLIGADESSLDCNSNCYHWACGHEQSSETSDSIQRKF